MALNPRTDKIVGAIDIKHPIFDEVSRVINKIKLEHTNSIECNTEKINLNHTIHGCAVSKIVGAIDLNHPIVDELRTAMNTIKDRVPEHIIDRNVGSLPANQYPYVSTVVENKRQ